MAYNASTALAFCRRQIGRYRDGECWTLVEDAVVAAGGRSSRILTPHFSAHASYVWGTVVPVTALQAGDVLQFGSYSWTRTIVTDVTNADGSGSNNETFATETRGSPQHSAMVESIVSPGTVKVIEQNVPPISGNVHTVTLVLSPTAPRATTTRTPNGRGGETVTTVTVTDTVTGVPRCYRPIGA